MGLNSCSREELEHLLRITLAALERIRESDPGPAYHIAKAALEEVSLLVEE